ncbi:probable G protein-coupled receptor 85 [Ruditapes philippinarum]|uniref:probable G protein-coupled receptor 85 n=1 Tax=Ruditapes philippinarum TaxID=129788 RepID=UPI00295B0AE6|nr:probable G protein-coupled receptor 85 [Ruditapes philippinarum]
MNKTMKVTYNSSTQDINCTFEYLRNHITTKGQSTADVYGFNQSVILGFLFPIVSIGIISNVVIIYVISSDRKLHKAPFYFLICNSVMDLSKSIFCLPFVIEAVLSDFQWIYDQKTCTVLAFSNSFFTVSTVIGFLAIVIDRYLSVTSVRFYSKCSHGLVNLAVIIVGWGVAFCLSFPPIFEEGAYQYIPSEMQCTFFHLPYRENETLGYTISFVCLLCVIMFLYCRLFLFMRSHRKMAPLYHEPARSSDWAFFGPGANGQALINLLNGFAGGPPNPIAANAQQIQQNFGRVVNLRVLKNEHITRVFFATTLTFLLLWSLYLFQVFVKVFYDYNFLSTRFILCSTMLSFCHVVLCPIICLLFGSPLRTSLFSRLRTWCEKRSYTDVSQNEQQQQQQDNTEPSSVRCIELAV